MKNTIALGLLMASLTAGTAFAQDATSTTTTSTTATTSYSAPASSGGGGDSDLRLVGQVRLDSINLVGELGGRGAAPVTGFTPVTPFFTAGVRILDTRLFIGAGIGFAGVSQEVAGGDVGRFSFSLSPVASFDFISNDSAALYGIGMLNLISVGESETEPNGPGNSTNNGDDGFGLGLNAGVGIRGKLTESLGIATEFGWGFTNVSGDGGDSFDHGLWASLVFEASTGL